MAAVNLEQQRFTFRPTSYTVSEQKTLFTVRDSYFRVTSADVRIETAFTGGTPSLLVGTVADTDHLVASGDVTEGTVGVYEGSGAGLSNGGALLAPGTAVIVDYTAHASTTQGIARVVLTGYRVGV